MISQFHLCIRIDISLIQVWRRNHPAQDWKDCLAVEMLNSPVLADGDGPPPECDIESAEIAPMFLSRLVKPACQILDLHVYDNAF